MKVIVVNEWLGFFRNKLFLFISIFFAIFLSFVTYIGILQNNMQNNEQELAHDHIRAQWDEMEASNPHSAAHYGSYAFKPLNVLNSIDEGVNSVTGNVLRLEGHRQNDIVFSEASQSLMISKFGKLKPSLIFQFIIPLFLIFLSFNSYNSERKSGRLKLLLAQNISLKKILFSKIFSIWLVGVALLFITILMKLFFNLNFLDFDIFSR